MHVEDVARAFAMLVSSAAQGAFNIGSGEAIAVRALLAEIGAATGGDALIDYGARPAAPDEPGRLAAQIDRLRDEIGFRPNLDLATGIARTVDWWRAQARP
jgi:nucleoside-diphosphate-sugar epimerase